MENSKKIQESIHSFLKIFDSSKSKNDDDKDEDGNKDFDT